MRAKNVTLAPHAPKFHFVPSHVLLNPVTGRTEDVVALRTNRNGLVLFGREDGSTGHAYPSVLVPVESFNPVLADLAA